MLPSAAVAIAPALSSFAPPASAKKSSGTPRASTHTLTPWPAWFSAAARVLAGPAAGRTRCRRARRSAPSRRPRPPAAARPPRSSRSRRRASCAIRATGVPSPDLTPHVPGDRLVERRRPVAEAPARARRPRGAARRTSRRRRSSGGTRAWRRRPPARSRTPRSRGRRARARGRPPPGRRATPRRGRRGPRAPARRARSAGSWRRAAASSAPTTPLELAEVAGVDRPRAVDPLAAEHPAHPGGERVVLAGHAVAVGLRPHRRLAVGHPRAAHVEVEPAERVALHPHAAADPVARLQHRHRAAARLELTGGDEATEARADHHDVAQVPPPP